VDQPWMQDLDRQMLQDLNPEGAPRAVREIIEDQPLDDREALREVKAPTLLICRRGDVIHPPEVGEILAEVMPNAELIMFDDGAQMFAAIPQLVERVREHIAS
jgi:pimeloyl-ACP methyl ester carboxylesterase